MAKELGVEESRGKKIEGYGDIEIYEGFPSKFYDVNKPPMSEKEEKFAELLIDALSLKITYTELARKMDKRIAIDFANILKEKVTSKIEVQGMLDRLPKQEIFDELKNNIFILIKRYVNFVKKPDEFASYVLDNTIGFGKLAPMLNDEMLEEIMVNGYERNVFIFHRQHGMCKTNIVALEAGFVDNLITRVANTVNKKFNASHPLLDARLPDGSRANATFSFITPAGPSLTIRKFNRVRLSVIDLINNGTFSSELAAFLWVMVEGLNIEPMNIIVSGGTSTGKTTTLNALSAFIRYRDRLVSIEDTLELILGNRENWIQMESKTRTREQEEVTMDDLLKNSLRMRPDRIILGEVRGKEAQTLFVAMDVGHRGCMGTLHANNARETLLRLKSEPMNVPNALLPLLNLIVVQERRYTKDRGLIRRVSHVAEIGRMEEQVLLANVFEWDSMKDEILRTDIPPNVLEILATRAGLTKKEVMNEIIIRRRIMEWMQENNIAKAPEVETVIQEYYHNPAKVIKMVSK